MREGIGRLALLRIAGDLETWQTDEIPPLPFPGTWSRRTAWLSLNPDLPFFCFKNLNYDFWHIWHNFSRFFKVFPYC